MKKVGELRKISVAEDLVSLLARIFCLLVTVGKRGADTLYKALEKYIKQVDILLKYLSSEDLQFLTMSCSLSIQLKPLSDAKIVMACYKSCDLNGGSIFCPLIVEKKSQRNLG